MEVEPPIINGVVILVVKVGAVAKTARPVPVSSLIKVASCAEVVVANCDKEFAVVASPVIAPVAPLTDVILASVYVVPIDEPFHVPELIVPTDVRLEFTTPDPNVLPDNTLVPLILYALPEARSTSWLDVQAVVA